VVLVIVLALSLVLAVCCSAVVTVWQFVLVPSALSSEKTL